METRRRFLQYAIATMAGLSACGQSTRPTTNVIPVILDTDIGDDIDDTWALLMLLRMPQFDVKLAVGDFGNAIYRARLLAKLLEVTGRTDVPVGVGVGRTDNPGNQSGWLGDYNFRAFPGTLHRDGVQAIIDTIHESPEPVTLLCLGPVPNIAEALKRDPSIADNARIVGMHGSIYTGYDGEATPAAEWNVRVDPQSLQALFAAQWDITITPLDTCGLVVLDGDNYQRIYNSNDPWLRALIENYKVWLPNADYMDPATDPTKISSTLFDTVAVYLAAERDLFEMRDLPLRVTDDGYTIIDEENGRNVHCATGWKDLPAFEKKLTDILLD
ncbi:MAG: nucleoside hydrolase [Gammaproteobacteria bacterium]|nr:nucleoside hydrolase [Gammaproteobacteria bacterium]